MNKLQRRLEGLKRARRLLRIYRQGDTYHSGGDIFDEDNIWAKKLIHTRVPCSCMMCGNPRRKRGELTIQERKAEDESREQTIRE